MKKFKELIAYLAQIFNTMYLGVFTKKIAPYKDRQKLWEFTMYFFAVIGALLLSIGKVAIGLALAGSSFLSFLRSTRYVYGSKKRSELTAAIYNKDVQYLALLLKNGTDPNENDGFGHSPLSIANKLTGKNSQEIVNLLKANGAKSIE